MVKSSKGAATPGSDVPANGKNGKTKIVPQPGMGVRKPGGTDGLAPKGGK